jgi:hypothetical protein
VSDVAHGPLVLNENAFRIIPLSMTCLIQKKTVEYFSVENSFAPSPAVGNNIKDEVYVDLVIPFLNTKKLLIYNKETTNIHCKQII